MGGKTFGVEARRLDSTQHAALFKYVQTQLDPFTRFGLRTTRSPGDKTTHGDLDVMIGSHANGPGFKYQFAGEASKYVNLPQTDYGEWSDMASTAEHQWTEQELKDWIRDVARALGAVVWQKHRIGAIFAVPCRVIGDLASEAGPNEVDLNIVLPDRLNFGEFILSYGITPLFINQVLKQLSPSFKIHHEHFVVHHSPYLGEPVISVELTGSAEALLEWLGLNYGRWQQGFETQEEYQRWLAGVFTKGGEWVPEEGMRKSRIALGWARLVEQTTPIKDTAGHQKERIQKLEDFRTWLRSINFSSLVRHPESKIASSSQATATLPPVTHKRIIIRTEVTLDVNLSTGETIQEGSNTTTINATSSEKADILSIDPRPLDDYAIETLRHFGKLDEYERILAERRIEVAVKVENRKRKEQNRNFGLVHDSRAARDIKRAEGRWT